MASSVTVDEPRTHLGNKWQFNGNANLGTYATGGVAITAEQFGLTQIHSMQISTESGYFFEPDIAANASSVTVKAYTGGEGGFTPSGTITSQTAENVDVTDDDSAASNGVALYLHTKNGVDGWLEFVSPTNADGTGSCNNGGATYFVFDSDAAATDGVAVYFDEDAANEDERFLVVSPSNEDIIVPVGLGKTVRFKHDASAASSGVQVYFDEDAGNAYERLLFVSPTDTSGNGATDDASFAPSELPNFSGVAVPAGAAEQVANATDLSSVSFRYTVTGI